MSPVVQMRARAAAARRFWLCATALVPVVAACGGPSAAGRYRARAPVQILQARELGVAALARPTTGVVHLSLWIDAGSRDAPAPQVATAAAWIAAGRGGPELKALVTPDGTELSVQCAVERLQQCLNSLAGALSTRDASEDEARDSRLRLSADRTRAEAADAGREADRLALEALLGPEAHAFFPLGEAERDREVSGEALRAYYRQHYGPRRALLVAAGDVQPGSLRSAAMQAFARAPRAEAGRANRSFKPEDGRFLVKAGSEGRLALAAVAEDLDTAFALGRALSLAPGLGLDSDRQQPVAGRAFFVRGGALLLFRLRAADPAVFLRRAAFELFRLREEGLAGAPAAPAGESLPELARAAGANWCADTRDKSSSRPAWGAGVLIDGGRADRTGSSDPDAETLSGARAELERAISRAQELARPRLGGAIEADSASARAANGARIEIRKRSTDRVAVAVRFARGAGDEPASLHGRAALLSTAAAGACRSIDSGALRERLREIDATLWPAVDGASWGLVLEAPGGNWPAALDIVLRCALYPSIDGRDLVNARLKLVERLGPSGSPHWSAAQAAGLIAPGAPGLVAPWGTTETAANLSERELKDFAYRTIKASGLAVAVVGDLPVEQAAQYIARRIGHLRPGRALSTPGPEPAEAIDSLRASRHRGDGIRAIAAWRVPGAGAPGALAFASLMSAALNLKPGIRAVAHDGGDHGQMSWAWVSMLVSEESLDALQSATMEAARSIPARRLARLAEQSLEMQRIRLSAARSRPAAEAERLAVAAVAGERTEPSAQRCRAVAAALAGAQPFFVIARPR